MKRIEDKAFWHCDKLVEVKLSRNLEYIHWQAFAYCKSLFSIFLPETCRWIYDEAFLNCENLIIFRVYQQTMLGSAVLLHTALIMQSSYQEEYENRQEIEEIHEMVKAINLEEEYALHRICASDDPPKVFTNESVASFVEENGLQALRANKIGITPLKYLSENPNCEFRIENVNLPEECAFGITYDPYAFHRQCKSEDPPDMDEILHKLKEEGIQAICVKNEIGITPLQYLMVNPITDEDIKDITIVKRFILDMIGETPDLA